MGRSLVLTWSTRDGRDCLCVRGWGPTDLGELRRLTAPELSRRLAVLPGDMLQAGMNLHGLQHVAGRFEVTGDAVDFISRFPFIDGTEYALIVNPPAASTGVWTIRRPPRAAAPTTSVLAIYPSADAVPVNLLKLYLHFSAPMSEGWAARAVHVRRADDDEPLAGVFLPMEPELWDWERRRLTLLLDPGRIKRGLAPHEQAGYPLIEGAAIVVRVEAAFRDAEGQPLRVGAERRYHVTPPVRARVVPAAWRLHGATAGTLEPLKVEFDRPLDHALLAHTLSVIDATGALVAGRGSAGAGERCWRFEPQAHWKPDRYAVVVDPLLEDLAGNSCTRVFDRDLTHPEDTPTGAQPVEMEFTCS